MALDHFAIVSGGAYPKPTPTMVQRSAYAVSYGLLGIVYTSAAKKVVSLVRDFLIGIF